MQSEEGETDGELAEPLERAQHREQSQDDELTKSASTRRGRSEVSRAMAVRYTGNVGAAPQAAPYHSGGCLRLESLGELGLVWGIRDVTAQSAPQGGVIQHGVC